MVLERGGQGVGAESVREGLGFEGPDAAAQGVGVRAWPGGVPGHEEGVFSIRVDGREGVGARVWGCCGGAWLQGGGRGGGRRG